ncbi:MAG: efflux RND transporter periplasmic adaptor subunit [Desulfobacteraceae bacterium]|nr:efflux RND transporter periplasmic adaptor subunit [Desulfobacteraceae bacterium]
MDRVKYRKNAIYIIVPLVAVIALLLSRCFSRPASAIRDFQLVRVASGDFDINVKTVGVLDAARTHMVSSTIRGDKGKIIFLVEDGSVVTKDDVLVRLDPTPFETEVLRLSGEVRSLEAAVESAKQMLKWEKNQMELEIQTAEFNLKVAELELHKLVEGDGPLQLAQYKNDLDKTRVEYDKYQAYISDLNRLQAQGFTNPTELALARKKVEELDGLYQTNRQRYESYKEHVLPTLVETARAKVDKAGTDIRQVKKGTAFKVARAASVLAEVQGKSETAVAALKQALAELKKTTIRPPFGGIAILYETFRSGQKRTPRVGDRVWQNQPLLYLPDISTMIVKTRIREIDLHKIAIGQPCSVHVDAYPDTLFPGEVTTIGMLATGRFEGGIGEKYFQLTVTLTQEDGRLRPGMTARVTIEAGNAVNILFLPVQAIFNDGSKTFCYLAENHEMFWKKEVLTGRQNEDLVEIVSGLQEGDRVSLLRPSSDQIVREDP